MKTVTRAPLPQPVASGQVARVLFPDEFAEDDADQAEAPTSRRAPGRPLGRIAAYTALGLLAGSGLIFLGAVLAPAFTHPLTPEPAKPAALVPAPLERLDRTADTLALATGAFDLRLRLFQSHQMQCSDLARGLVVVEQRWAEYSAARTGSGVVQDSTHIALDRALYAGVDATERQFEQSKCPRP